MVDWSLEDLQKKERKRRAEVEMVKPERKREDLETSGPRVTCRFFFFFFKCDTAISHYTPYSKWCMIGVECCTFKPLNLHILIP
jgi:hypothetical protein